MGSMPEKQRKQIEYIDEIYNKVVLKRDTSNKKERPKCQAYDYRGDEKENYQSILQGNEENDFYSPFGIDLSKAMTHKRGVFSGYSPSTVLMLSASDASKKDCD